MFRRSSNHHRLSAKGIAICLWTAFVLPPALIAQKTERPRVSAEYLSGYVMQGLISTERIESLLQHSHVWDEHAPKLLQALNEADSAWCVLQDGFKTWMPKQEEWHQQVPQHFAQLVSVARSALLQSIKAVKESQQYGWMAAPLASSLRQVEAVQTSLKQILSKSLPKTSTSKKPVHPSQK